MPSGPAHHEQSLRHGHRGRWALVACILLALGAAFFLAPAFLLHRASGILRQRVIQTLSGRFHGRVELPDFEVSVSHGFQATGRGLRIWTGAQPTPMLIVDSFRFHIAWWQLLRSPMHVGSVALSGLIVHVPSAGWRSQLPLSTPGYGAQKQQTTIIIDQLTIHEARLVFAAGKGTDKPGHVPTAFLIHSLSMQRVGRGQPMRFHATLVNPKPIGDIDTSGIFGPFDTENAGASPVSGVYSFSQAELNSIHGIGGTLSSTGRYQGRLSRIVVDGATDTPNFSLDVSGHPLPLRTRFHAIVDGTSGDTYLDPVDAWLNHSHLLARGSVVRVQGGGHLIRLQLQVGPRADIGDLLTLAMKARPPLMHGQLRLATTLVIPPGPTRMAQKLNLQGRFQVANAVFPNPQIQSAIDQLSLRGQGYPDAANGSLKDVRIPSQMQGVFTMGAGRLTVPQIHYAIPGATIQMRGVYAMDGSHLDFAGDARLQARISQMVSSWWKQLLLSPVNQLFSKHGTGTDLPIVITGDKHGTHVGMRMGGMILGN